MSGGEFGQRSMVTVRPHAMAFFNEFSDGRDDLGTIQTTSDGASRQARPRKAIEKVLGLGERASVIGTLRQEADGALYLEAAAGGLVANVLPGAAEQLVLGEAPDLSDAFDGTRYAAEHMKARAVGI